MKIRETFIVDYGCGNFSSLRSWLRLHNLSSWLIQSEDDFNSVSNESLIILPGVGHFGRAMSFIDSQNYFHKLQGLRGTVPILGICLGAQIMFSSSEEAPDFPGLCWLPGSCTHLPSDCNPRLGWYYSQVQSKDLSHNTLIDSLNGYYYYNHCYQMPFTEQKNFLSYSMSDSILSSFIAQDLLFGCQFHPERSQRQGRDYLSSLIQYLSDL